MSLVTLHWFEKVLISNESWHGYWIVSEWADDSVINQQFMQATIWAKTGVEVLERAIRFLVLSRRNACKETWCRVLLSAICHAMFYGWMFAVDSRPRFSKCILQKSTFMAIHTFGFYPDSVVDSEMSENILPCKAFLHFFFGFSGTHKCFERLLE